MEKELTIVPPEGYEIDRENSTLEIIKFKPIKPNVNSLRCVLDGDTYSIRINGVGVGGLATEEYKKGGSESTKSSVGGFKSGHSASLYLHSDDHNGYWIDELGKRVSGYFFYKPITSEI